jgi:hypothetical protein
MDNADQRNRIRSDAEKAEEKRIADKYTWRQKDEGNVVSAIGPILDELANHRGSAIADNIEPDELIKSNMLSICLEELKHYHTHFWSIFKWLLTISVVFLSLPFVDTIFGITLSGDVETESGDVETEMVFRFVFPIITVMVSVLSLVIIKIESTNIQRLKLRLRSLAIALNERYDDFSKQYFTREPLFYYFVRYEPVNMAMWFYAIVAFGAIMEAFYFSTGKFALTAFFSIKWLGIGLSLWIVILLVILFVVVLPFYFFLKMKREKKANFDVDNTDASTN